jgi:hypothetical protein
LKIAGVATDALGAESDVLPDRRARVAGIARKRRVGPQERETIPVILNGAGIHAPAEHRVTALALGSELALVEIRMAIRATGARFGKDFRYVAGITRHILVHAAKLEVRFGIVIKFEPRAKRGPTRSRVTILTRERELPMRVSHIDLRHRRQRHP